MNIKINNIIHAIIAPAIIPVLRALDELLDDVRKTSPTVGLLVVFTLYNLLLVLGAILGLGLAVMGRTVGDTNGDIVGLKDGIKVWVGFNDGTDVDNVI